MTQPDGIVLHIHGPGTAAEQLDTVSDLYAAAFFPPPHNQGPTELGRMIDAWPRRLATPGFRLVIAEHDGEAVGCTYGHQLRPDTTWWNNALEPLPSDVTTERAGRTLALIDMMVREEWRRHGIAEALNTHLLAGRTEERVTLLVDPANEPARAAYRKWGYEVVGRIQPFPNSPKFEAMIKPFIRTPARQDPDGDEAEHELVAARVLGALLADMPETVMYIDHIGDEPAQRRHEFRLLYEQ